MVRAPTCDGKVQPPEPPPERRSLSFSPPPLLRGGAQNTRKRPLPPPLNTGKAKGPRKNDCLFTTSPPSHFCAPHLTPAFNSHAPLLPSCSSNHPLAPLPR